MAISNGTAAIAIGSATAFKFYAVAKIVVERKNCVDTVIDAARNDVLNIFCVLDGNVVMSRRLRQQHQQSCAFRQEFG